MRALALLAIAACSATPAPAPTVAPPVTCPAPARTIDDDERACLDAAIASRSAFDNTSYEQAVDLLAACRKTTEARWIAKVRADAELEADRSGY